MKNMRYIPVLMALIFFSCGQEVKKDKKDKEAKKEF